MLCPLCYSSKNSQIFIAQNIHGHHLYGNEKFEILKCTQCQCIFPKIKTNLSFYKKYYPNKYQKASSAIEKILSKINILIKFKYLPKSGTLLDVGSGRGEYINSLPLNIKSTGIDLNPVKNNKNEVIKADFLKYKFTQKFDVITFWHSLEHFSDPQKAITKTLDLLKSKGKILIAIPNTNSLAYKIGEKNWFHLDAPRHLFLPNNQNIKYLFPKGTKINIYYTPYEFPLDLFWSLKNKKILRLIYPFLKIFDKETMLISVVKPE